MENKGVSAKKKKKLLCNKKGGADISGEILRIITTDKTGILKSQELKKELERI